jgi:methylmalonyl-CoA mutase C-terminal domain/subunit
MELLKDHAMDDVLVTAGGIIPKEDRKVLEALGVSRVFGPGTLSNDIVDYVRQAILSKRKGESG